MNTNDDNNNNNNSNRNKQKENISMTGTFYFRCLGGRNLLKKWKKYELKDSDVIILTNGPYVPHYKYLGLCTMVFYWRETLRNTHARVRL